MQWLLAGLSLLAVAGWLGHRIAKRAEAKRASRRASIEAAARAEAQCIADIEAAEEAEQVQAAALVSRAQATQAEAARLAAEEAARIEQARVAAQKAEAARLVAEEVARIERARVAAQEAALAEATRIAAQEARAEEARLAAKQAARLEAAHLEAERLAAAQAAKPSAPIVTKTPDQTVVMIADDSKIVRVKTGRLLAKHQYQVSYAADGLDAARQMRASLPDVVITDLEMPGMDGFELARLVRHNPLTAHIPVIMITAANDKHRDEADRSGVSVLLGKPYAEEELIEHIRLATNQ